MRGYLLLGVILAAALPVGGTARAQSANQDSLAEAEELFDGFQFEAAIAELDPLIDELNRPGVHGAGLLARCYELRGRAAFNLGRAESARSDFARLLEIDAGARLPEDASPRLIALFDAVRAETVGTLFVTMDPPGRLVLGGREIVLETFDAVIDVVAGSHTIVASLLGHREQQYDVVIEAGQGYSLDIRLERVSGSLTVATDPPGVRVAVDGQYVGTTAPGVFSDGPSVPVLVTDLMPGQHRLRLERPCSVPQSLPFNIPDPPVDADIGVVELEPAAATAMIETQIEGAMVYVDGLQRGRAPAQLDDICPGARKIEVRIRGQRFIDRRVWRAGDTVTLRADFRWAFMLLPGGSMAERDNRALQRIEAALQGSQRVLVALPSADELDIVATAEDLRVAVTDETLGVAERRIAGERLADALNAQGVAWVTPAVNEGGDAFSLSLVARGSGVPDRLLVRLADLGSLATAVRSLGAGAPGLTRPSLGVSLVDVADVDGAAIVRVPTDEAGQTGDLEVGDVVIGVDGEAAASVGDVDRLLSARAAGEQLRLNVRGLAGDREATVRVTEFLDVLPLVDPGRLANLLLPAIEEAVAAASTPLAESAGRLNLAVVHMRLQNWNRALRELDRVALPEGPGVSAGTVSYLSAICFLEISQLSAAEAALRRAVAFEDSLLFVGGPRVSPLARQRLREFFDRAP